MPLLTRWSLVPVASLALALAGCGGSDTDAAVAVGATAAGLVVVTDGPVDTESFSNLRHFTGTR